MKSIWELGMNDIISPALQKVQGAAKDAFANIEHMELGMKKHTEDTTHSLHEQETMLGSLREAAVEFFAVEKFMEMGSEILHGGMAMEMMRAQFNTLTGSVAEGGEAFEALNNTYKQFPILGKENTMKVGEQLLAVGVHVENLSSKIYQMGSIAGGNGDKLNELANAYGRAVAFGSVQSRQLMGQPVLMEELRRMYGMTGVQMRKFASEGNISLKELDQAFANLTGEGGKFHNMLENLGGTVSGHVAHMKMQWEEMGEKMFNAIAPTLVKLTDLAEEYLPKVEEALRYVWNAAKDSDVLNTALDAVKWGLNAVWTVATKTFNFIRDNQMLFYVVAGGVAAYNAALIIGAGLTAGIALWGEIVGAYEIVVFAVANSTSLWTAAMWLLNVAMDANPIGIVIGLIGGLVAGIMYAWTHFEGFRKFMYSLWETMKQVFSNIGNFFKEIFSPISKFLEDFKKGDYTAAAGDVAQLAYNLSPVGLAVKGAQFAANGGFTKGIGDAWDKGQKEGANKPEVFIPGATSVTDGIKNSLAGKPVGGEGESSAASGTSGGSSGKNITFNIQSLVREIHIHTAHIDEGIHQATHKLKKSLIAVTNDAETAMGGN